MLLAADVQLRPGAPDPSYSAVQASPPQSRKPIKRHFVHRERSTVVHACHLQDGGYGTGGGYNSGYADHRWVRLWRRPTLWRKREVAAQNRKGARTSSETAAAFIC